MGSRMSSKADFNSVGRPVILASGDLNVPESVYGLKMTGARLPWSQFHCAKRQHYIVSYFELDEKMGCMLLEFTGDTTAQ